MPRARNVALARYAMTPNERSNHWTRTSHFPLGISAQKRWLYRCFRAFTHGWRCSTLGSIAKRRGWGAMAMLRATTIAARLATDGAGFLRRCAALLLFITILSPSLAAAQGGPQCPLQVFSGNFQGGDPGDVIDLTVRQGFSSGAQ